MLDTSTQTYAKLQKINVKSFGDTNMKKTAIAAALLLTSGVANSAAITSLEITGGSFGMNGGTPDAFVLGAFADMTVGGYDGSAPMAADFSPTSIASFAFGTNGNVAIYTAETDGVTAGFAAPTGDITGGVATLELPSWTAWWNGTSFNQGSTSTKGATETCVYSVGSFSDVCSTAIVVDSYDAGTGAFTASWDSVVVGGAFNSSLGNWQISGVMSTGTSAVPVPAAVWLFGSGLVGLAGVARRRKAA